jgi:1,2-diacylglycerol 3-alpha-glucosyltransferase
MTAQSYRPPLNGEAVFAIRLAEGLAAAGHEVTVAAPSRVTWPERTVENGVEVCGLFAPSLGPIAPHVHVTPLPRLGAGPIIDEIQPEVVHVQDHYPLCRAMVTAARARGLPVVGSNHFVPGNMIPLMPRIVRLKPEWVERALWYTVLSMLNRVDLVTTPTETAASILGHQEIHVPVRAISCGVDLDRFQPEPSVDRRTLRLRYGFDPERTLFLYVGRVDRDKGLDVLIDALAELRRDDVQVGIAGHGGELKALQRKVRRLGLDGSVAFGGYVPDADLPALLNSADVFVMPSEVELQSIATLEAMGTGRPVLAADAQALPELVHDGSNGYVFRPGDAQDAARCIAELADHPEQWEDMGCASLEIVSAHRFEHTLCQYEAVYRSVLNGKERAVPVASACPL